MLQVSFLKSTSRITSTASLMVYSALSIVSISVAGQLYWSLILRS